MVGSWHLAVAPYTFEFGGSKCTKSIFSGRITNFYTIWRMDSDFYLYLSTFSNILFNRLSISFKYYFFHSLFIIFLTTTHLPTFFYSTPNYYNRKKRFWRMNSSLSNLMSYCSFAKKNLRYRGCWSPFFCSHSLL